MQRYVVPYHDRDLGHALMTVWAEDPEQAEVRAGAWLRSTECLDGPPELSPPQEAH